ncbi:MAG: 3-phenylpropionate/cinnamic acid dioxygenase subunit beta [Chloroflexi bacterium]|nr:3-phenylpropionate/cinnamic acid dioxygenase subunit beta [Chloroflexota bacterium]
MATELASPARERALLRVEIEDFLYYEAELLDERRYHEWLELFADDLRYWMPMRRNVEFGDWERETTRELQDMCWMDEGKSTLRKRVDQILTGKHWAEEPLSRVCHLVTNVHVIEAGDEQVRASSRFLVYRNRQAVETDFFVGRRVDTLRRHDDSWLIARREIFLEQNVLLAKNLTLFF